MKTALRLIGVYPIDRVGAANLTTKELKSELFDSVEYRKLDRMVDIITARSPELSSIVDEKNNTLLHVAAYKLAKRYKEVQSFDNVIRNSDQYTAQELRREYGVLYKQLIRSFFIFEYLTSLNDGALKNKINKDGHNYKHHVASSLENIKQLVCFEVERDIRFVIDDKAMFEQYVKSAICNYETLMNYILDHPELTNQERYRYISPLPIIEGQLLSGKILNDKQASYLANLAFAYDQRAGELLVWNNELFKELTGSKEDVFLNKLISGSNAKLPYKQAAEMALLDCGGFEPARNNFKAKRELNLQTSSEASSSTSASPLTVNTLVSPNYQEQYL